MKQVRLGRHDQYFDCRRPFTVLRVAVLRMAVPPLVAMLAAVIPLVATRFHLHADVTKPGLDAPPRTRCQRRMIEAFITTFIIYFVVIDPVGNAPIFLAVTEAQVRTQKLCTALEGTAISTPSCCSSHCVGPGFSPISTSLRPPSRLPVGIILFLVALDMLAAKRQQRKRAESTGGTSAGEATQGDNDNETILPSTGWPSPSSPGHRRSCR